MLEDLRVCLQRCDFTAYPVYPPESRVVGRVVGLSLVQALGRETLRPLLGSIRGSTKTCDSLALDSMDPRGTRIVVSCIFFGRSR